MSNYLQKIIYLSQSDYETLLGGGSITRNGRTLTGLNPNYIYITDETDITTISGLQDILDELDEKIIVKTTAEWQAMVNYIPPKGTILVYSDAQTMTKNNTTVNVPGIKIADGLAYGIDQPFIDEDTRNSLLSHINDSIKHITSAERTFWNNKLNCQDSVINETLVLNRS